MSEDKPNQTRRNFLKASAAAPFAPQMDALSLLSELTSVPVAEIEKVFDKSTLENFADRAEEFLRSIDRATKCIGRLNSDYAQIIPSEAIDSRIVGDIELILSHQFEMIVDSEGVHLMPEIEALFKQADQNGLIEERFREAYTNQDILKNFIERFVIRENAQAIAFLQSKLSEEGKSKLKPFSHEAVELEFVDGFLDFKLDCENFYIDKTALKLHFELKCLDSSLTPANWYRDDLSAPMRSLLNEFESSDLFEIIRNMNREFLEFNSLDQTVTFFKNEQDIERVDRFEAIFNACEDIEFTFPKGIAINDVCTFLEWLPPNEEQAKETLTQMAERYEEMQASGLSMDMANIMRIADQAREAYAALEALGTDEDAPQALEDKSAQNALPAPEANAPKPDDGMEPV